MFLQQIHNLISRKLTDEKREQYFKQWKDLPPFVLMGSLRTKVEKKKSIKIFKNKPLNLPHKGSRTSLLLQWQSQPPASIFAEEKNTWSFLFEKLYYSATVCGLRAMDDPAGVYGTANTVHSANAGQGQQHSLGRHPCAYMQGGRHCKLLSADNLAAKLALPSLSHFTTFQKAEETKPHTVPTTIWRLQQARDSGMHGTGSHRDQYSSFFVAVSKAKREW